MFLFWFLLSYLAGSIPTGFLFSRYSKIDIRQHGSGNIGATNITRVMGLKYGLLVLLIDASKGFFPVVLTPYIFQESWPFDLATCMVVTAVCTILGHTKPVWLRFYGGKGVATALGTMIGLSWPVALIGFGVFLLFFLPSRYVSLGSMTGAISVPISMVLLDQPLPYYIYGSTIMILILVFHRGNIYRLRHGLESKLYFRKKKRPIE